MKGKMFSESGDHHTMGPGTRGNEGEMGGSPTAEPCSPSCSLGTMI